MADALSLVRPRTLLILNYIMLHHTIIFNLELHVQISKRCICGSENSHQKLKSQLKRRFMNFYFQKRAVRTSIIQIFMEETIEKSSRHLFPSDFLATETAMCRSTRIYCIIFLSILSYDMIKSF